MAGHVEEFNPDADEWILYQERLENYFIASKIVTAEDKRANLLRYMGARAYKILRDLCSPEIPSSRSYEEIISSMEEHFTPAVIIFKERKLFYEAKKGEEELISEWHIRLKNLAYNCKFGKMLNDVIRDKFITGIDGTIFMKLSEESKDVELKKAVETALKMEQQEKEVSKTGHIKYVNYERSKPRGSKQGQTGRTSGRKADQDECFRCGYKDHHHSICRYKSYVCRNCKNVGHLAYKCKYQKKEIRSVQVMSESDCEEEEMTYNTASQIHNCYMNNIDLGNKYKQPILIEIKIYNVFFKMELDTGAAISAISEQYYQTKLRREKLRQTGIMLQGYGGHLLKVMGVVEPMVSFRNLRKRVSFAVVKNGGPAILGRNFIKEFGMEIKTIEVKSNRRSVNDLVVEFGEIFKPELGKYKYEKIKIEVSDEEKPVFCKPRPVPFAFRMDVEKELEILEEQGVITPIKTSRWGTPLVPVLKEDGRIRICGDYKTTLNKYVEDNKYPMPRIEDLFYKLRNGVYFSKLDLTRAYNQLELDEESKLLCAWSTHKGVYAMNRLPFGIKPASGIFQKIIEKLVQGIPGVVNFLDDIVVTGNNEREHIENLCKVFQKLKDANLRLNISKCKFFEKEVKYLGYVINQTGLRKTEENVDAIMKMPRPTTVKEVKSFLGAINYYGKFVNNITNILFPLYSLLKAEVRFEWTERCEAAFKEIKKEMAKEVTLVYFNSKLPIVLTCDASNVGIGAVLAHKVDEQKENPIAFMSRTLSKAEVNYSMIEKEALAIVVAVKKFYQYLIGQKFILVTDHKPLLAIFGSKRGIPQMAASRMQRWALFLSGFNFEIRYVKSENNNADILSRLPIDQSGEMEEEDVEINYVRFMQMNEGEVKVGVDVMREACEADSIIKEVIKAVKNGREEELKKKIQFKNFISIFKELNVEEGILMRGFRMVIPLSLRNQMLRELHSSHLGMVKTKSVARSTMWWPNIDKSIEEMIRKCEICSLVRPDPPKSPVILWENAERPWSRIHMDFFGPINNVYFLVIVDAYSKWPEVFKLNTITTRVTIEKLRECFGRFGLPEVMVCDNGRQFTSKEFEQFAENNGIRMIFTPPGHPATNGAAENFVKTCKLVIKKFLIEKPTDSLETIMNRFLLEYRVTKHCTTRESPDVRMFGRNLKTRLTKLMPTKKEYVDYDTQRNIRKFKILDKVMVRDYSDPNKKKWQRAEIMKVLGPRTYVCKLRNGREIKRHIDQIIRAEYEEENDQIQEEKEKRNKEEEVKVEVRERKIGREIEVALESTSHSNDNDIPVLPTDRERSGSGNIGMMCRGRGKRIIKRPDKLNL